MKCPWADGECQDQKYVELCKAYVVEEIKFQMKFYKQEEKEAAQVVDHNERVMAPFCWRLKKNIFPKGG